MPHFDAIDEHGGPSGSHVPDVEAIELIKRAFISSVEEMLPNIILSLPQKILFDPNQVRIDEFVLRRFRPQTRQRFLERADRQARLKRQLAEVQQQLSTYKGPNGTNGGHQAVSHLA